MEYNRFKQHPKLHLTGLIFLVLSMSLFAFSIFILPFLLFDWVYDVPEFILHAREWLHREFGHEYGLASFFIFLFFFLLAVITGSIARKASVGIDQKSDEMKFEEDSVKTKKELKKESFNKEAKESASILSKIIILIVIMIVALSVFELLLYIEPPPR